MSAQMTAHRHHSDIRSYVNLRAEYWFLRHVLRLARIRIYYILIRKKIGWVYKFIGGPSKHNFILENFSIDERSRITPFSRTNNIVLKCSACSPQPVFMLPNNCRRIRMAYTVIIITICGVFVCLFCY